MRKAVRKTAITLMALVLQLAGAIGLSYMLLSLTACSSWEHQLMGGLAVSRSIINDAGHDYNSGLISRTQAVYDLLLKARTIHDDAASAFFLYVKIAYPPKGQPKGTAQEIADAKAKAQQAYLAIAPVVAQVKAIAPAASPKSEFLPPQIWSGDWTSRAAELMKWEPLAAPGE